MVIAVDIFFEIPILAGTMTLAVLSFTVGLGVPIYAGVKIGIFKYVNNSVTEIFMDRDKRKKRLESSIDILDMPMKNEAGYSRTAFCQYYWWILAISKYDSNNEVYNNCLKKASDYFDDIRINPKYDEFKAKYINVYYFMYSVFSDTYFPRDLAMSKVNIFVDYYETFCKTHKNSVNTTEYEKLILWYLVSGQGDKVESFFKSPSVKCSALMKAINCWILEKNNNGLIEKIRKILNKRRSHIMSNENNAFLYYYVFHYVINGSNDISMLLNDIYGE